VYEEAPGGGGEKLISDSGWQSSYLSEEDIHRLAIKVKMWNFSLLAVNTLGILWVIRRLRATAQKFAMKPLKNRDRIWRWVFLCSLASYSTIVGVYVLQRYRGYPYLDVFYYPVRAGIVTWTLIVTQFFLLLVSPLFFQRLGALAISAWIIALVSLVWAISHPQF
jgi:hypothetical protein